MNSLTFLYIGYFLTILIYVAVVLISTFSVIPMQKREAQVKDFLHPLRKQFYFKGQLTRLVAITSILALTSRYFVTNMELLRYVIVIMIFSTALEVLIKLLIERRMYKQRFFELVKRRTAARKNYKARKLTNSG